MSDPQTVDLSPDFEIDDGLVLTGITVPDDVQPYDPVGELTEDNIVARRVVTGGELTKASVFDAIMGVLDETRNHPKVEGRNQFALIGRLTAADTQDEAKTSLLFPFGDGSDTDYDVAVPSGRLPESMADFAEETVEGYAYLGTEPPEWTADDFLSELRSLFDGVDIIEVNEDPENEPF